MTVSDMAQLLMGKALRASRSAEALLALGDTEGACNRAYYAMFDAAKAALFLDPAADQDSIGKTHSGLMTAFSLRFVKDGPIPKEIGRLLKRAEEIRLVADYTGDEVDMESATEIVSQAGEFLRVIQALCFPET